MRLSSGLRAAISLAVGFFITFSQDHSASIGLIALGIYGVSLAAITFAVHFIGKRGIATIEAIPFAVIALIIGVFAFLVPQGDQTEIAGFIALVTAWGLLSGVLELYAARKEKTSTRLGRDYLISAVFALLLGALFLFAPLDIVSAVGFFGAYLVISAVHLGISAATPSK